MFTTRNFVWLLICQRMMIEYNSNLLVHDLDVLWVFVAIKQYANLHSHRTFTKFCYVHCVQKKNTHLYFLPYFRGTFLGLCENFRVCVRDINETM